MKNDAIIARDIAKSQLEEQEKEVYAERRKRELELHKVRKEAEEKKMLQERYQYRIVSIPHFASCVILGTLCGIPAFSKKTTGSSCIMGIKGFFGS